MLQAILLHLDHVLQLAPPGHQMLQFLLPRRGQRPGLRLHPRRIEGQDLGVQAVVLAAMPAPRAKLRTSLGLMKQAGNAASRKAARRRNCSGAG